ncbi:MAG: hypothetical protein JEY99_04460 [Spirochaetales bacterium]|nr:hypothetical protein [Spirochaetales bacterium]
MKTKFKLLTSHSIFFILLVVGSPVIIMSPMILDSADPVNKPVSYYTMMTIVYSLWTLLPVFIIGLISSIILYIKKRERISFFLSLLPLLNVFVFLAAFLLLFVVGLD